MLKDWPGLTPGLKTLKAALSILSSYYPDCLGNCFFWRSDFLFWTIFKVFSLWVSPRTRGKFRFFGKSMTDYAESKIEKWISFDQLPEEYGGKSSWKLGQEDFLKRAILAMDGENYGSETSEVEENGRTS